MNYLAHAFLSRNNPELLVGNFIADHLRGNDFVAFSEGIVEGIKLHRKIDVFTDSHPDFLKSKRLFYDGFEKFSGVLVDIYFDHFFARNFKLYSKIPLDEFAKTAYKIYSDHKSILPAGSLRFLEYMIKNNIYVAYSNIEGIKTVLFHLSHRIKHPVELDQSVAIFEAREKELKSHFETFFSDAISEFAQ